MTELTARKNDVIIVGAGHNGLTAAAYLARAGLNVEVLEASSCAGGMAATRSIGSNYLFPGLAHLTCPPDPRIVNDLRLRDYGYTQGKAVGTVSLGLDGQHTVFDADGVENSTDDAAYRDFRAQYLDFARAVQALYSTRPPRLKHMDFADKKTLAKLGLKLRFGLGKDSMYEFLRVAAINIYDVLNEAFDDDRLKGAIATDAVMGSAMGPRTPGTVLTWLQRLQGELHGPMSCGNARTLVDALTQSAEAAGANIRYGTRVSSILIENDKCFGVELDDGSMVKAPVVISAIDPRTTFTKLVGAPRLDTMFASRASQVRGPGTVGKLNIALSGLPEFDGLEPDQLASRMIVAPSMRYVERAFNPSKYGEIPEHPVLEITIPSLHDPSLAPDGHHVMSVNVAYLPYDLKGGWDEQSKGVAYRVIAQLGEYAPELKSLIVDHEFLSPADIEREYGAVQGHWHHGDLSIHQSFMLRPTYGAAQYDTPIDQLFICSAGSHPGGGVTGMPGRLAAARVLETGATK